MTGDLPQMSLPDWKPRTYIVGALIGLVVGLLAAYFYARVSEEDGADQPQGIKAVDTLKLAVSVLGLIRQITDLGARGGDK